MINYTMAREHFIDMGEQVHKHIYDINLAWGQFLDFYSDLNNARKAHEDSFVERQYIGEELVEPDENPISTSDLLDNFGAEVNREENKADFFNAFEDGFEDILSQSRGSISGSQVTRTKPQATSQNMLGELQKEIQAEEEGRAPLLGN